MKRNSYSHGCPSCGSTSGYGPDEDGAPTCLICDGPTYCGGCGEPIITNALDGPDGYSCEDCGEMFHGECFPRAKECDEVICKDCWTSRGGSDG